MRQSSNGGVRKTLIFLCLALFMGLSFSGRAMAQEATAMNQQQANPNIVREVRHQLVMLPYYTVFDWITYQVNGNDVTLNGEVAVPVNKDDAQAAVKKVEGVGKITNNIKILPPSPMDNQIRRAEYRAIFDFDSLGRYAFMAIPSIHIIVDGGHVTLEGIVDNQADKDAVNIRANGVANVFSVTNNLRVQANTAEPKGK